MNDRSQPVVEAVRQAAAGSTAADRAELIEEVVRTLYDHVKFRVPGGQDSEERDALGKVLNSVIAYADHARAETVQLAQTLAQQLLDQVLDRVCQEHPSSQWVLTVPLEVAAMLPLDDRPRPGLGGLDPLAHTYRGADVVAMPLTVPLVVLADVATDANPVYLNLNTRQVGGSPAEVGLG